MVVSSTPEIVAEFGRGNVARSLIIAVASFGGMLAAPFVGIWADKYGRRKVLTVSLAIFGLAGVLGALAPTFEVFIASRVLVGAGSAGLLGLSVTSIADFWEGESRAKYIGYNSAALSLGLMIEPPIGGWVADVFGWRYAVAIMSVGLVVSYLIWNNLPEVATDNSKTLKQQLDPVKALLKEPLFLLSGAYIFIIFVSIFGAQVVGLPEMLREQFGMSEGERSIVFAVGGFSAAIGGFSLSRIKNCIGTKYAIYLATFMFASGNFVAGTASSEIFVYFAMVLFGFAEGFGISIIYNLVASLAGIQARATALMAIITVARLGQVTGSFGFGWLADFMTEQSQFLIAGGLYSLALIAQLVYAQTRAMKF